MRSSAVVTVQPYSTAEPEAGATFHAEFNDAQRSGKRRMEARPDILPLDAFLHRAWTEWFAR